MFLNLELELELELRAKKAACDLIWSHSWLVT
jgi:hypothetical protein